MSKHRNKGQDQRRTLKLIEGIKAGTIAEDHFDESRKNWLGHFIEKGAAGVDRLLLKGASRDELERCRGAVDEHIYSLKVDHGLPVVEQDGKLRFDEQRLRAEIEPSSTQSSPSEQPEDVDALIRNAAKASRRGGEGKQHIALKEYVKTHPEVIGLEQGMRGENEIDLLSGDRLDVSFISHNQWTAVEVKAANADVGEIGRGLYQCVKYRAVMEAEPRADGRSVRVILVLEGKLPDSLIDRKKKLGVEVVEGIRPRANRLDGHLRPVRQSATKRRGGAS